MEPILFYEREFYPFSNFSAFMVRWKGIDFMTSEHAYHWEKFVDHPDKQTEIVKWTRSAHDALKIAHRYKGFVRKDWDDVKVSIMKNIIHEKAYQHEYIRKKMADSGIRELIEDSWRDPFWGWGPNKDGLNQLGKLWMQVREESRHTLLFLGKDDLPNWIEDSKEGDQFVVTSYTGDNTLSPSDEKTKVFVVVVDQVKDEQPIVRGVYMFSPRASYFPKIQTDKGFLDKKDFKIIHDESWAKEIRLNMNQIFFPKHVIDCRNRQWELSRKL